MASTINASSTGSGGLISTGDASGQLELQTNGTTRVTLNTSGALGVGSSPSYGTAGQVLTSNGSGSAPTWGTSQTGAVLQVVNTLKTSIASIASTTFADISGLSATITPTSASNKVLVLVSINGITIEAAVTALSTRILRGATVLGFIDSSIGYSSLSQLYAGGVSIAYLDSPATTSATTYKIQFATNNGNQAYINNYTSGGSASTITLMEVTP